MREISVTPSEKTDAKNADRRVIIRGSGSNPLMTVPLPQGRGVLRKRH
jgi:hypothetical protein